VLPHKWLVESTKIDTFKTKSMVDIYAVRPDKLAQVIDNYISNDIKNNIKQIAYNIGMDNFSVDNLKSKYLDIIKK
jgi:hypothetical protein